MFDMLQDRRVSDPWLVTWLSLCTGLRTCFLIISSKHAPNEIRLKSSKKLEYGNRCRQRDALYHVEYISDKPYNDKTAPNIMYTYPFVDK